VIRAGEKVFVDTGAWIALFERQDPLHARAAATWEALGRGGARLLTSIPVVLETYTFLDRRSTRELALRWKAGLDEVTRLTVVECTLRDLGEAWPYLERKEFHKLGLVDATSFVLMRRHRVRVAFAFDVHFGIAGFRYAA
jgi:predicted nucleic acid-binding protein